MSYQNERRLALRREKEALRREKETSRLEEEASRREKEALIRDNEKIRVAHFALFVQLRNLIYDSIRDLLRIGFTFCTKEEYFLHEYFAKIKEIREHKRIQQRLKVYHDMKENNGLNRGVALLYPSRFVVWFECDGVEYKIFTPDYTHTFQRDTRTLNIHFGREIADEMIKYVFTDDPRNFNCGPITKVYSDVLGFRQGYFSDEIRKNEIKHMCEPRFLSHRKIILFVPDIKVNSIVENLMEYYGEKQCIAGILCAEAKDIFLPSLVWKFIHSFINFEERIKNHYLFKGSTEYNITL
jgi:hypothetical protein